MVSKQVKWRKKCARSTQKGQLVIISWEIIGIYVGMVIFGLVAYAYIIPYFVVRKIRKLVEEGWAAKILGELIPQLLSLKILIEDKDGEKKEIPMVNYLVSVGIQNLKMQLNALKSSIVRGVVTGDGEDGSGNLLASLDGILESVPKKWRWAAQLFAPFIAQRVLQGQAGQTASQTAAAGASPVPYRGV